MDANLLIDSLAREGRLQEARRVGEEAVAADPHDDAALSALVGVYLEIESQCISTGVTCYLAEIDRRLDELIASMADGEMERRRHERLRLAQQPGYDELSRLEALSARDGYEQEAYEKAHAMFVAGNMSPGLHEIYATIIYRYARVAMTDPSSRPVRSLLFEYLGLPVRKPSRVHSLVLRLAVRCARKYPDFNFTRFFDLWNPRTFRDEDIVDPEGKSSLAAAAFELVIDSDYAYEFPALLDRVKASAGRRMMVVREAFVNLISRQIKAGDTVRAIDLLELYARYGALHDADALHSRLLALALRVMTRDEMWRFVGFFINWNTSLLRQADFEPTAGADGETIRPLATRAIDRCFAAVKADVQRHAHQLPSLLEAFDRAVALKPEAGDELYARRRAMLLSMMERDDEAMERMSTMAADGTRSAAFWLDFAEIAHSRELKMGLLSLGVLQHEESRRDDPDIDLLRLRLARLLHIAGDDAGAATELEITRTAAEPMPLYGAIKSTLAPDAEPNYNNEMLYHRLASEALAAIYRRVKSEIFSIIAVNDNELTVACTSCPPLLLDFKLWPLMSRMTTGDNVEIKRTARGVVMARPRDGKPFAALAVHYGVVLPNGAVQCADIPEPIAADGLPSAGRMVRVNVYLDAEYKRQIINAVEVPSGEAREHFEQAVAAIFAVNAGTIELSAGADGPFFEADRPIVTEGQLGAIRKLYFYTDRTGKKHVVGSNDLPDNTECDAVQQVSGRLTINRDGTGMLRDVLIPRELIECTSLSDSTYAACTAILTPTGPRALTLTPYV